MKRFNHLALFPVLVFILIGFFVMPATPALASGAVHRGIERVERSGAFLRDVTYDFVDVTFLGGASLAETGGDILSGLRATTYSFVDATMSGFGLIGSSLSELGYASHNFSKLFYTSVNQEVERAGVVALASGIEAFNHLSFGFEIVVGSIEDVRRSTERTGYEFGQTIGQGFLALGVYPEEIWDLSTRIAQNNPVLDGVNLVVRQFEDDHDEYQPPPLKLMANASSALDSWWGTIINGVDTAITRVVDFFSDSDTTIVEAPVPVAPTVSVLPQPTTPVVTTFAPTFPLTPVSTNVYTTNQYVTTSGNGVSITQLALAIIGLREELEPKIERAMNSPRSNFNASSGDDDDDDDVDLSGYLELIGGTLTGSLGGTDATFSGDITSNTLEVVASTTFNGVEYLFPSLDGSDNYVLTTDGNGGLTWEAGAVGGITSLGGLGAVSQTFATSSDTNIGLSIVSSGSTHTFTPTWIGTLASGRGGTGTSTVNANELLIGNAGGTAWTTIATSSLGFATPADLTNYLTLTAWFATTTDALDEGLVNLYYEDAYVADYISASTTIANAVPTNGNILLGNGSNWLSVATTSLGFGDVVGPVSATDDAIARYDLTTGKIIQNSGVTINDSNRIGLSSNVFVSGELNNFNVFGDASGSSYTSARMGDLRIHTSSPSIVRFAFTTGDSTFSIGNSGSIKWTSNTTAAESGADVGLTRNSAGVLRVSNGSSGGGSLMADYFTATSTTATSTFAGGLSVAGSTGLTVLQNGNVGIGTANPGEKLELGAGGNIKLQDGNAVVWGSGSGGTDFQIGNGSLHFLAWYTDLQERMRINAVGNVGVGTTSPYAKFSVTGDMALTGGLYDNTASLGSNGWVLQSTGTGLTWVSTSSLNIAGGGDGSFVDDGSILRTAGGEGIQASHIVSTSTATSTFAGDISIAGHIMPASNNVYDLGAPNLQWRDVYISEGSLYIDGQKVLQADNNTIVVSADMNQSLRLQTSGSGDVEINPTGAGLVYLKGNILVTGGKTVSTSDGTPILFEDGLVGGNLELDGNTLRALNSNGSIEIIANGVGDVFITNGDLGVGTTSPSQKLHVEGNARITGALYDGANSAGSSGSLLQSTGTSLTWVATSTLGISHASLTGLTTGDSHTQYALLAGRSGGQTLYGGTAASQELTLDSTSNATKGVVNINSPVLQTYTVAGGSDNYFRNLSSGATAQSAVRVSANVASGGIIARGSSNGFNVFGIGQNSLVNFAATAGSGLNIGTTNSTAVGIGANNALQMIFDTSGNVGVGTAWGSTSEEKFSVSGDMWTNGSLVFEGSTANTSETTLSVTNPTADRVITIPDLSGTLVISDSVTGFVGIGTTSPYAKLSVTGDMALTGGFYDNTASRGSSGWVLQSTGTGLTWVSTSSLNIAGGGSSQWTTSGSNIYYTTGNVGIGDSTPSEGQLTIVGSTATSTAFTQKTLYVLGGTGGSASDVGGVGSVLQLTGGLGGYAAGSNDTTGGLGGGVSISAGQGGGAQDLEGNAYVETGGKGGTIQITGGSGGIPNGTGWSFATGDGGDVVISSGAGSTPGNVYIMGTSTGQVLITGGKFGFATSTPFKTFSVQGTVALGGLTSASGSSPNALCLKTDGEVVVNTGAQTCTVSSLRFKHDVSDLTSGLDTISELNPSVFVYNDTTEERIGLIAEEVALVDDRLIFREADGRPRGVRYEDIVAVLVKAVQELSVKVDTLLASAGNTVDGVLSGIKKLIVTDEICIGATCVDEAQLKILLEEAGITPTPPEEPPAEEPPVEEPPTEEPPVEEPPVEEPPTEEPPIEEPPVEEVPVDLPAQAGEPPAVDEPADEPIVETPEEPLVEEGA